MIRRQAAGPNGCREQPAIQSAHRSRASRCPQRSLHKLRHRTSTPGSHARALAGPRYRGSDGRHAPVGRKRELPGHAADARGTPPQQIAIGMLNDVQCGLAPVITKFGFHWRDGQGRFECLALVPSENAGTPRSGNFDTNAMYVTGEISSAEIHGARAILRGVATVTGLGAGSHLPFTATAEAGGPGARLVLVVSGLTFDEVVIDGAIAF